MSTLRWNPLLGEWIIITQKVSDSPLQQPDRPCPFCPNNEDTEGDWSVRTIENNFSALDPSIGAVPLDNKIVMEAPAYGHCRLILLSPDHYEQIEVMDDEHLLEVFREYRRVFIDLDKMRGIEYVMLFENRGISNDIMHDHPHAEVYAFPFIPQRIERELYQMKKIWEQEDQCLICQIIGNETKSLESRIINATENFLAVVPFFARFPYEVHIYPKKHVQSLIELEGELLEMGQVVQDVVKRFSKIFDTTTYNMAFHTRPSNGDNSFWHFHIELCPTHREKLESMEFTGIDAVVGVCTNNTSPEENAEELRRAV